jgi:hypothetical protein
VEYEINEKNMKKGIRAKLRRKKMNEEAHNTP